VAGKTTRVTAVIQAQVTGTDDLADLAKQLGEVPDKTTTEIAAQVSGQQDIDGLSKDLAALPSQTTAAVSATVAGDELVHGLSSDLEALPGSVDTKVAATVTGDTQVGALTADIRGLPGSTETKVDTTVTGSDKVDALVTKLEGAPKSTSFTVTATVQEKGKSIKQLGDDVDTVKEKAGGLASAGSGLASQFLGPMSNAIGVLGDLAEQFHNVSGEAEGAGSKMAGFAKVGAGIGATIIAGLAIDAIVGEFGKITAAQQEVAATTDTVTAALVASGGEWDKATKRAEIAALSQTSTFKTLISAGIDYTTVMDGLTGKAGGMDKLNAAIGNNAGFDVVNAQAEANALSGVGSASSDAATGQLAYLKANDLLTDSQKAGMQSSQDQADGIDLVSAALQDGAGQATLTTAQMEAAGNGLDLVGNAALHASETVPLSTQALIDQAAASKAAEAAAVTQAAESKAAADAYAQSLKDQATAELQAAQAAAQHALDSDAVSTALNSVSAAADASKRSIDFLQTALDKLSGRTQSAEDAAVGYNEAISGVAQAAADAAKNGGLNAKALKSWNVAALTATKTGQEVFHALDDLSGAYTDVVGSTFDAEVGTKGVATAMKDARAAADTARATFVKNAESFGLTKTQAEGLADKLGVLAGKDIPDKTFKVIADDKKAQAAVDAAKNAKITDKTFKIDGDNTKAENVLTALKNQTVADKVQKILGDGESVTEKIAELKAIGIPDKYAKIIAQAKDTDEAQADIQKVADHEYDASITVHFKAKNQEQANLINFAFPGAGVGVASTAPEGPTVSTSSAGVSSTAAPGVRSASLAISAPGVATYSIVIQGAVDKDGTARALEKILDQRARRVGPTVLGRPRAF
jgi:hypothetical protein